MSDSASIPPPPPHPPSSWRRPAPDVSTPVGELDEQQQEQQQQPVSVPALCSSQAEDGTAACYPAPDHLHNPHREEEQHHHHGGDALSGAAGADANSNVPLPDEDDEEVGVIVFAEGSLRPSAPPAEGSPFVTTTAVQLPAPASAAAPAAESDPGRRLEATADAGGGNETLGTDGAASVLAYHHHPHHHPSLPAAMQLAATHEQGAILIVDQHHQQDLAGGESHLLVHHQPTPFLPPPPPPPPSQPQTTTHLPYDPAAASAAMPPQHQQPPQAYPGAYADSVQQHLHHQQPVTTTVAPLAVAVGSVDDHHGAIAAAAAEGGGPTSGVTVNAAGDVSAAGKERPSKKRRTGGSAKAKEDGGDGDDTAAGAASTRPAYLPSRQSCVTDPFKKPFNDMLYELLRFRLSKGHMRVPPTHGNLGVWVYRLRVQHQALQRDPTRRDLADLTRDRIDILNSLDFCWDLHKFEAEKNWTDRYNELVRWKEEHGNCNVPQSDPNLGKWVKMQRDYYNNTTAGKKQRKGSLTQDKIDKLEAIGFEWRLLKMVGWDKRFEELCEWKRAHGHCNVPTQTTGSLGRWVSKQRIQMTYRRNGEYSQLTDDRIDKLNSIGFVWNTKLKGEGPDEMEPPPQYHHLYEDTMGI